MVLIYCIFSQFYSIFMWLISNFVVLHRSILALKIYLKKIVDFLEKIQQFGTKIVEFDEQLFISFLFTNNEQFILLTNNEYSRTNKKHNNIRENCCIYFCSGTAYTTTILLNFSLVSVRFVPKLIPSFSQIFISKNINAFSNSEMWWSNIYDKNVNTWMSRCMCKYNTYRGRRPGVSRLYFS